MPQRLRSVVLVVLIVAAAGGLVTLPRAARPAEAPPAWDGRPQLTTFAVESLRVAIVFLVLLGLALAARAGMRRLPGERAGFLMVGLLFAQYAVTLRIGGYIFWYVFLALAYAQFAPLQIGLTCATLAVGIRLIAVGTVGRTRPV